MTQQGMAGAMVDGKALLRAVDGKALLRAALCERHHVYLAPLFEAKILDESGLGCTFLPLQIIQSI